MRLVVMTGLATWAALASAAAQDRFDLRDWSRRAIPGSPTVFYDCAVPRVCGPGSAVSARLQALPAGPSLIDRERERQQLLARRMRERSGGRIVEVDTDDTRERTIDGLRALVTQKVVTYRDGRRQAYIDAVLLGRTRSYSIVASGDDPAQVRRNFEGYARLIALALDQIAAADLTRPGRPGSPRSQQPRRPRQAAPPHALPPQDEPPQDPQYAPPPPQTRPPRSAPPPPAESPQSAPPQDGLPPGFPPGQGVPPANFPPPPPPPR